MADIVATINSRAGSGTITLTHSSFTATTMEVDDIGTLEVDFDLESDKDVQDSIFFTPSEFKFTAWNQLGNADFLFDYLDAVPISDDIIATLDFTTDAGLSFGDEFVFNKEDVRYRATERKLEIEAFIDSESDITIGEVFTAYPEDVYTHYGSPMNNFMPAQAFIENYFKMVKPNNTFVNYSNSYRQNPFTVAFNGDYPWVIGLIRGDGGSIRNAESPYSYVNSASLALFRLASIDGSVVGSLLGESFISHRLDNSNTVSITNDEVEDYDVGFGVKNYRVMQMLVEKIPLKWVNIATGQDTNDRGLYMQGATLYQQPAVNPSGNKELSVYFQMNETSASQWNDVDQRFESDGGLGETQQEALDRMYPLLGVTTREVKKGTSKVPYNPDGNAPSFAEGDLICAGQTTGQFYTVKETTSNSITIYSKFRDDIASGESLYKVTGTNGDNLFPTAFSDMVSEALDCYGKAFGGSGSREVEFTIWDIDKLKPFSNIETDASFTEQAIQNKIIAPSKVTYNLETDKIIYKGYDIT